MGRGLLARRRGTGARPRRARLPLPRKGSASEAGAEVVRSKQEIPNIGFAAYIRDPEGNTVGLFEPLEGGST